jgi:proteasome lid subunit RPN8/RPN11
MIAPDIGSELWQVEGLVTPVEYSRGVIEELGIAATEGFNRLSHGGVEIGGVLFGIRTAKSIEVCAYRALECEYALGPSFTLSEKDRRGLEELIASAPTDPDLADMQPVGWYHSHTRSDIALSEKDLELYRRYFPEPWQIALVLRPHRFDPVRAGFFFREADGSIHANATRQEFIIRPRRRSPAAPLPQDAEPLTGEPQERAVQVLPAARLLAIQTPLAPPEPQPEAHELIENDLIERRQTVPALRRLRWVWLLGILAVVVTAALSGIGGFRSESRLSLRALDVGGQLRIEWNRDARAIRNGAGGTLEIEEGSGKVRNELSGDELRAGSVTYMRNTGNVLVRLEVRGTRDTVMETTRFLGSPAQNGTVLAAGASESLAPEPRVTRRDDRSAPPSEPKVQSKPPADAKRVAAPEDPVAKEVVPVASAIPSPTDRRFVAPHPPTPVRTRSVDIAPPAVPTAVSNNAPFFPASLPHLPSAELPKQVYRGPTEGKIIWAGKLARHGTIEIQGNRASQGHVTGGLPGVPVRVQVFPAELTPGGLRIFTADPKGIGDTEAPGAQNGWNRTSYVLNSAQSDRLRLIEAPSAQNAWNRVMVRAERGDQTIIILKWELAGTEAASAR